MGNCPCFKNKQNEKNNNNKENNLEEDDISNECKETIDKEINSREKFRKTKKIKENGSPKEKPKQCRTIFSLFE